MHPRYFVSCAALLVNIVFGITAFAGGASPVRFVSALLFAFFVVGWSVVAHLRLTNVALATSLSLGLGLAIVLLAAEVMIETSSWHPVVVEKGLVIVTAVLLLWSIMRERGHRAA